ncbi:MAG TPA: DUF2911 domain-containing protein [Gemmatimonadaceae bacterium]|nr:DUF2911 domain-containing protein [Gemmatimonadaceae bacterium]
MTRLRFVLHRAGLGAALLASAAVVARPAAAQVRMSERASVSQVLDGATIALEYYRPVARGRDSLFGKVVRWNALWTPGANWATTLEADRDVRLNGQPLAKGKYSIWMVPRQSGEWTVILDRQARRFHTVVPTDTAAAALRFTVAPEQRPVSEEVLTWSFPSVAPGAATLRLQWGTTALSIRVAVEPKHLATIPAGERATYVGDYAISRTNGTHGTAHVVDEAGTLRVHQDAKIYGLYDYYDLVPDGEHRFKRALYQNDKVAEVESEFTYVFDVAGGRATRYRILGPDNEEIVHAERITASAGRK